MASLGGKRQRRNRVLGGAAGVLVFLGASTGVFLTSDAGAGALLKILSPAGSGYDATSGDLTTSKGGAVAFTRASTWTCQDSSGAIRSLATNKPCVVDGASLRVRGAVTNLLARSDEISAAPWGVNGGAPVVSPDTWDYGFGPVGDEIVDDSAAAQEGYFQTYTTSATGAYTLSCYAQSATSATLRLAISVTGGTGSNSCIFTDLTTSTQRKSCSITAGGALSALVVIVAGTNTATETGTVRVGGCQLVASSQPGDYCPTAGTSATCAAETATVATPAGLSRTEGAAKLCFTPSWTGANPFGMSIYALNANAAVTARLFYIGSGATSMQTTDGTSFISAPGSLTAGLRQCYRTSWSASGNFLRITNLESGASSSAVFPGFAPFSATLDIGGLPGGNQINGNLDGICLSKSPNGCQ